MVHTLSNPDSKFLVITSLIGTDKPIVLEQTKELQPPVPPQGNPEYQTFIHNFVHSPANVMSTIASFLQRRAEWDITSPNNFQNYLNSYNGAPFITGYSSGISDSKTEYNSVSSLLSGVYLIANVPTSRQNDEYGLKEWLDGDFEDTPKTLHIITQNLQATGGNLLLLFTQSNFTISYFPPRNTSTINRLNPTYKLSGNITIATVTIRGAYYFEDNGAQFLPLGFVNVTDWIKKASTPPIQP